MQTDTWLTETPYPDRCPLCNQLLTANSNTCPSCGFTTPGPVRSSASIARPPAPGRPARQPNPVTPIPARASAQRTQQPSPGTGATGWKHHSANYEAASSLSSLSLIISETPTAPPRSTRRLSTGSLQHIDEIDTLPPPVTSRPRRASSTHSEALPPGSVPPARDDSGASSKVVGVPRPAALDEPVDIAEIDTVPEHSENSSNARSSKRQKSKAQAVDAASWTSSSSVASSARGRLSAERLQRQRHDHKRNFHLLDHLRWWLLRPGHIEFLLWLSGSILLFGITFLLLLAIALNMVFPGTQNWGNLPNSAATGTTKNATISVPSDAHMRLALSGSVKLQPGSEFQLRGQGFLSHCQVTFLLDDHWPLLDQNGHAVSVVTDGTGDFTVNLWLGSGSAWSTGTHQVMASETGTDHQASTTIMIVADPVASSTQIVGNPAPQPTQVPSVPTPVPPTPTRPVPVPTSVPPTPTPGITPTTGPSPTAVATPTGPVLSATPTGSGSSALGNALNSNGNDSLPGRLAHLDPLVWLIIACYLLSMVFLVLAGLLRRRRPAKGA